VLLKNHARQACREKINIASGLAPNTLKGPRAGLGPSHFESILKIDLQATRHCTPSQEGIEGEGATSYNRL
jgi:hypothetical protein